jgi:propanol-preferring alcohol dehydrogenase
MQSMLLRNPAAAENEPLSMTDVPKPAPAAGDCLIRVLACGVCHTDLHIVEGEIHPPTMPIVPGHQVVGVMESVGEGVDTIQVGMRVGVPWLFEACGACDACRRGEENLCPNARFTGFHVNGGYSEYMLARARYVLPIPSNITDVDAAPLLCAGIIGYRSLQKADLAPGEHLGLVGFGASAHLAIQVANYWGCPVYVFTRSLEHRQHARELGAFWVGGIEDQPPEKLDRMVTFAPSGKLIPPALEKLRPGGTLAINAVYMSDIPSFPYELIYGERTLRSVANATYQDGVEFLKLASEIPLRVIIKEYKLKEANQALIDLKHSKIVGEGVLLVG